MSAERKLVIPEDTCPYIDNQDDLQWRVNQAALAKALLEHVRDSNQALRTASKHWHDRAKKVKR